LLIYKLKHYKVKTPFCANCGVMVSNSAAKNHRQCPNKKCKEKL